MKNKGLLVWFLTIAMVLTLISGSMTTANAAHGTAEVIISNRADDSNASYASVLKDEETVTFIVEVEGEPLAAEYGLVAASDAEKTKQILAGQQKVMSSINKKIDTTAQKGFVYTAVFNGFTVEGTVNQMEEIKAIDGVKNVYISAEIPIIEPVYSTEVVPMLDSADEISGVNTAYDSGYSGEGTVIAVVDIGCDTAHDFFKTAPSNPRYSEEDIDNIVKTMPLNAVASSSNRVYKNAKIPYAYNYYNDSADTYYHSQLHGTHVAGIAAGKDGVAPDGTLFSGAAPDAQLLILSCGAEGGNLRLDAILAALNDAILLEADVINMSFGSDYTDVMCDTVFNEVLKKCREAGVSVIGANGNASRGYNDITPNTNRPDYGTNGTPASESLVTAVASVNNGSSWYEFVGIEAPDGIVYEAYPVNETDSFEGAFASLTEDEYLEYIDCGLGNPEEFQNVSGKLALVKRGDLTFAQKAENAKEAGAVGMLLYNYDEEIITTVELVIPAVILPLSEGTKLLAREDKRLRYTGKELKKKVTSSPSTISDFSSWGVSSTLELKPEIAAPGGSIYSAAPDNEYATRNGTSMAAPYISGITALTRQYYRTNPFIEEFNGKTGLELTYLIENLAMNSASVLRQENGVAYSPRVQGAGLVNMEGILNSRVLITGDSGKAKLSLGDDIEDTLNLEFDITNIDEADITFDKISVEVLTDGYIEENGINLVSDSVAVKTVSVTMPQSVTVLSGETVAFKAEVKLDTGFLAENSKIFTNGFYIDGYVILENEADSTLRASVPFTGFYGDWGLAPIFDDTIYDENSSYFKDWTAEYETGTFLEAQYDWGMVTLGRNPFYPEIVDEKYIAFSQNTAPGLGIIMTNFRAAKEVAYSIIDSEGTVILSKESDDMYSKFISIENGFSSEELSVLEEGQYSILAEATVIGDTQTSDELSIPFTIDNSFPEILSAAYDENEKTLTVTAKENHYFSAFYVSYPGTTEQQYKFMNVSDGDYAEDGTVTMVIDVSMIDDISEVQVGCIDYALNETYYDMDYFLHKVGAELTGIEQLESMTQVEFNLRNNTSEEVSADFVIAFYDDSEQFIAMNMKNFKIGADSEEELTYGFFGNTQNAAYVKLFVWNFDDLKPLDKLKYFALK